MKIILLTGLILFSSISFNQTTYVRKINGSKISFSKIDDTVNRLMSKANVQGLSLAILNQNKVIFKKAYGYKNLQEKTLLDTATVLYSASFSKAVFAFLTLKLVEEKILDLDTPLIQYLKNPINHYEYFENLASDDRHKLITARMCLSHTTGLPNVRWINVTTGEPDTTGPMKIYFQPGTRYAYSGEGMKLLQLVEEEITGRTIEELAREKIFKPFRMTRTGFIWYKHFDDNFAIGHLENNNLNPKKKRTVPVGSGSMVTTISDYGRFIENVMQRQGLNPTLFAEMTKPQIAINSKHQFPTITNEVTSENKDIQLSYGLGWGLLTCKYGRAFFKEGHDDTWRNYNINFIDKGISIIIITNSANGELIFKELLNSLIGDKYTPWKWERFIPYNAKA